MKKLLFSLLTNYIITGCLETDEIFREIPSDQDQFALQEMEASFKLASIYNDSLEYFTDIVPDLDVALFYDDLFHLHDALYDQYHQQYSHLNAYDDHHHIANPPDHRHSDDRHMDPDFFDQGGHDEEGHDEDEGEHDEDEGDHDEDEGDHDEEAEHGVDEEDHDEDANPDIYTHNLNSYTKMLSLRQHHEEYHPKN